jgi:hypothetical protein
MGKLGNFFVQYRDYLRAREILIKYSLSKKLYDEFGMQYIPQEVIDARFTIRFWKNRKVK